MYKEEFIKSLQKDLPVQATKQRLEKLREEEPTQFIPAEKEIGTATEIKSETHLWDEFYYNCLISSLEKLPAFSYERALHIVTVKEHLQNMGVKGFVPQQAVQNSPSFTKDSETVQTSQKDKKIMTINIEKLLNGYQPNEAYLTALNNKDTETLRFMLLADLNNVKVDFGTILKTGLYLEKRDNALFEEYAISPFYPEIVTEESKWNADYFSEQQVYLNKNFARERFLHLINVSEHLGKIGVKGFVRVEKQDRSESNSTQQTQTQEQSKSYSSEKPPLYSPDSTDNNLLKKALIVGGAILGIILALTAIFK